MLFFILNAVRYYSTSVSCEIVCSSEVMFQTQTEWEGEG